MSKLLENKKLLAICGSLAAAVILVGALIYTLVVLPDQRYETATQLFAEGNYIEAYETIKKVPKSKNDTAQLLPYYEAYSDFSAGEYASASQKFEAVGDYEDSVQMAGYCKAVDLMESKQYSDAYFEFAALGDFRDSQVMLKECPYRLALDLMESKDYEGALSRFSMLVDYKDSETQGKECSYQLALGHMASGNFTEALNQFSALADYKDSETQAKECSYQLALAILERKEYGEAYNAFAALGDYSNSVEMLSECRYRMAGDLMAAGDLAGALDRYDALPGYKDSDTQAKECRYRQATALAEENTVDSLTKAVELYTQIGEYKDAPQKVTDTATALEAAKRVPYTPSDEAFFDVDCTDATNIQLKAYKMAVKYDNKTKVFKVPSGMGKVNAIYTDKYYSGSYGVGLLEASDCTIHTSGRIDTDTDGNRTSITFYFPGHHTTYKRRYAWPDGSESYWYKEETGNRTVTFMRFGDIAIILDGAEGNNTLHTNFAREVRRGKTTGNLDGMVGGAIIIGEYEYFDLSNMRFKAIEGSQLTLTNGVIISVQTSCTGGDLTETYNGIDIYTNGNGAYIRVTRDIYIWCGAYNAAQARQVIRDLLDNYHKA